MGGDCTALVESQIAFYISSRTGVFVTDDGKRIPLRVSVGVAQHQAVAESLTELMLRADNALYRAKREGRNKVVVTECCLHDAKTTGY